MEIENKIVEDQKKSKNKVLELKVYSQPKITEFGSMQKITLDSSVIGTGDSGTGTSYEFE